MARICTAGRPARTRESQPSRLTVAFQKRRVTQRAMMVPTPPRISQLKRIRAMTNSLPWNWDKNSRIINNWVTTEEMPVAMTTRVMARSFFLFKILNLIGQNFQLFLFVLPGIARQTGLLAKVGQKFFRQGQLFPDLGQKSGAGRSFT